MSVFEAVDTIKMYTRRFSEIVPEKLIIPPDWKNAKNTPTVYRCFDANFVKIRRENVIFVLQYIVFSKKREIGNFQLIYQGFFGDFILFYFIVPTRSSDM